MLTRKENWRRSEEGFRLEIASPVGWDGFFTRQSLPQCPSPSGNNAAEVPQIRGVSDSASMVPTGSNKMQEASCQMSLSSAITGESGSGICLHSRNSSVHRKGEAEMAREVESNLGL